MQKLLVYFFKGIKYAKVGVLKPIDRILTSWIFYVNKVNYSEFQTAGLPRMNVGIGGTCVIGRGFKMNNREVSNPIGRFYRCSIIVSRHGNLWIGEDVGMSSVAIVCHHSIHIGNHVKLGGNVVIYDTDFHSLDGEVRKDPAKDLVSAKVAPVKIGDNAFIGAHTTILKGVEIGAGSIIGACSVVSKSIPPNEIWAGNPAKMVRKITADRFVKSNNLAE